MKKKKNARKRVAKNIDYTRQLREQIKELLPTTGLKLIDPNRRWSDRFLAIGFILWCWAPGACLKDRFTTARTFLINAYPTRKQPGTTYDGLIKCMMRHNHRLRQVVMAALRRQIVQRAGDRWKTRGFVLFAVDGTKIDTPRTDANLQAFGTHKEHGSPQKILTCLMHVATRAVWSFRHGDAKGSERKMLGQMLEELPENSMILADAGFTGWDTLSALMRCGQAFIIRAGANVTLLKDLRVRQSDGLVFLWPKGQQRREVPPLVLRLVTVRDGKGKAISLLTNVTDSSVLSDKTLCELYQMRWGIEVSYRWLKRTMQGHKMLSESAARVDVELDWTVLGLCMLTLISVGPAGRAAEDLSLSGVLRVIREVMAMQHVGRSRKRLTTLLAQARTDTYSRHSDKRTRHWPKQGRLHACGAVKLRTADAEEVLLYQRLMAQAA